MGRDRPRVVIVPLGEYSSSRNSRRYCRSEALLCQSFEQNILTFRFRGPKAASVVGRSELGRDRQVSWAGLTNTSLLSSVGCRRLQPSWSHACDDNVRASRPIKSSFIDSSVDVVHLKPIIKPPVSKDLLQALKMAYLFYTISFLFLVCATGM